MLCDDLEGWIGKVDGDGGCEGGPTGSYVLVQRKLTQYCKAIIFQ